MSGRVKRAPSAPPDSAPPGPGHRGFPKYSSALSAGCGAGVRRRSPPPPEASPGDASGTARPCAAPAARTGPPGTFSKRAAVSGEAGRRNRGSGLVPGRQQPAQQMGLSPAEGGPPLPQRGRLRRRGRGSGTLAPVSHLLTACRDTPAASAGRPGPAPGGPQTAVAHHADGASSGAGGGAVSQRAAPTAANRWGKRAAQRNRRMAAMSHTGTNLKVWE